MRAALIACCLFAVDVLAAEDAAVDVDAPADADVAADADVDEGAGRGAASTDRGDGPGKDTLPEVVADAPAPLLEAIEWVDRVYFKEETVLGFMRSRVGQPVDEDALADDAAAVEEQYHARGFLNATVDVEVKDGVTGPRALFRVVAGARAELKAVHVIGNERVSDQDLKDGFFSRPPEPLGALTRAGLFHRPYLDQDQQRLVFNYYKRGFLEARVLDTRVLASSDVNGLEVTLTVVEGAQFALAGLHFVGELPEGESDASLRARLPTKDGSVADLVTITQQCDPLLDAWRALGFPFARFEQQMAMVPVPDNAATGTDKAITLTFKLVKGPAARIHDVRVVGNKGTMPHVFAREILVQVGERYDHKLVKLSEKQLMQTGLLQAAQARVVPADAQNVGAGAVDEALVDVEFVVTETTTWLLSPAVFGDANEGLIFIGVAGDRNLFGTGLQGFASVQWSSLRFLFDASLTEPRLFSTRSSATIEAHRRELRYRDFTITSVIGSSLRANYAYELGFQLGGPARVFVGGGAGVEYGGVVPFDVPELNLKPSALLPQDTFRNTVELRGGFDSREGGLSPRNGLFASVDVTTAGPWTASGLAFVDVGASLKGFYSPFFDITLKSNTQLGVIVNPLGDQAPVTDRYFLGGLGSLRGFFPRSIGPVQGVDLVGGGSVGVEVGGVVRVVQNAEVEFPLWPGAPFRGFGFVDVGNAFGEDELGGAVERNTDFLLLDAFMMSTGFGVLLETPVLPFRFEWSVPVTRRSFDQPINFFLGVGSAF